MLSPGQIVPLKIEKPAAGGRMIARLDGQVVLVSGAIPGELVAARIDRIGRGVTYASAVSVTEPSPDRREPLADPLCGGCLYAHIDYGRQVILKGQVIADAFARIGRHPLPAAPPVASSPEEGYRMRARLHVSPGGDAGFFREGTHALCSARTTRQLLAETCDVVESIGQSLKATGNAGVREIDVSENMDASERVVHLEVAGAVDPSAFGAIQDLASITGLTVGRGGEEESDGSRRSPETVCDVVSGSPYVSDRMVIGVHEVALRRHVLSFFQGNRYLLQRLVAHVVDGIDEGASVIDLYAGVGLFSIAAAVARGARVTAVEGDPVVARDLDANADAVGSGAIEAVHMDVERFGARSRPKPDVLIVDPPRTGLSNAALQGAISLQAKRLIYVSCDVATLARDARKLLDAGYVIQDVEGFDLFPNTPHVEAVVRFEDARTP